MCPVYPFQNLIVKRLDTDTQPIKPQRLSTFSLSRVLSSGFASIVRSATQFNAKFISSVVTISVNSSILNHEGVPPQNKVSLLPMYPNNLYAIVFQVLMQLCRLFQLSRSNRIETTIITLYSGKRDMYINAHSDF